MNTTLAFDFSVDKANRRITIKREFAAELPLVWDAYTKAEILDQWWAPKPWKAKTKSMDFREGGRWHYSMVGPGGEEHFPEQEHFAILDYKAIKVRQGFTALDGFSDAAGNINKEMPRSMWESKFDARGDMTLVTCVLQYDDLAQLEQTIAMGFKEGLSAAMENLDALLPSLKKAASKK
jgi:uncharacterized protein YndB with AHSA1/START domain